MKAFLFLLIFSSNLWAQDPNVQLKSIDTKIYTLKNKGISDLVFEVTSESLTKQLNEEMIYGHLRDVRFKVYWTANPERLAIEVQGMPEGFKEIKEELKARIQTQLLFIFPPPLSQKFTGYKFLAGKSPKEIIAQDTTGIATIPKFVLNFDKDKLESIVAAKFVGTLKTIYNYERESYSDGRWVLKNERTESSESGAQISLSKDLSYGAVNGIYVVQKLKVTSEQRMTGDSNHLKTEEVVEFQNYKINSGEALKYFLGDSTPKK